MKSMKHYIITSNVGKKIVPIQKYLFHKYLPEIRPNWIDLEDKPIKRWCYNVAQAIEESNPSKCVVLWLDDHLLLDRVVRSISMPHELERLELGARSSNHKSCLSVDRLYMSYTNDTPYKVSTQPSIWRTDALLRVLRKVDGDPWNFEVNGVCTAGIVRDPVVNIIPESALSKKWCGVNLRGMKQEDIDEIIKRKYITENDIRRDNI